MFKSVLITFFLFIACFAIPCQAAQTDEWPQTTITPKTPRVSKYPRIVLYSVSWCPHCKRAKEYLTSHNIPFINKDVELDQQAMQELTEKYKSHAVPVIVIGDDGQVLKGFDEEKFEKILTEMGRQK